MVAAEQHTEMELARQRDALWLTLLRARLRSVLLSRHPHKSRYIAGDPWFRTHDAGLGEPTSARPNVVPFVRPARGG